MAWYHVITWFLKGGKNRGVVCVDKTKVEKEIST